MDEPTISVVMPVRNAAKTLADAIESICTQSFPHWELLIYDDGSTDESRAIATNYARTDHRLQILGGDHVGIVESLRRACAKSRGKYIARMDADDISYPSRLERQLLRMETDTSLALCGARVDHIGDSAGEGESRYRDWLNAFETHEQLDRELFIECPIAHPTFFLRREVFEACGGYADQGWPEDYDLLLRLWRGGARFAVLPEQLLAWRHSADRLSRTDPRYALPNFRRLKRHYIEPFVKDWTRQMDTSRDFIQWGAGAIGKPWLREWNSIRPVAVVDVDPRKIGSRIHGVPVISPDALPGPGRSCILIAVGAPGARATIRAWLQSRGYSEPADFRFIA